MIDTMTRMHGDFQGVVVDWTPANFVAWLQLAENFVLCFKQGQDATELTSSCHLCLPIFCQNEMHKTMLSLVECCAH